MLQALRLCEEGEGVPGILLDVRADLDVTQVGTQMVAEVAEEAHEDGRSLAADGPAVQDWNGLLVDLRVVSENSQGLPDREDIYLFVDFQDSDAVLAAFGKGLGERVLGLVLALAVDDNRHGSLTLGEEEKLVDAIAHLLRQLQELEGLGRLEEDDLVAFIYLALRNDVLGKVSDSRWTQRK